MGTLLKMMGNFKTLMKALLVSKYTSNTQFKSLPPSAVVVGRIGSGSLSGALDLYQFSHPSGLSAICTHNPSSGPGRTDMAKMSSHLSSGMNEGAGASQSKSVSVNSMLPSPGLPEHIKTVMLCIKRQIKVNGQGVHLSFYKPLCQTAWFNCCCVGLAYSPPAQSSLFYFSSIIFTHADTHILSNWGGTRQVLLSQELSTMGELSGGFIQRDKLQVNRVCICPPSKLHCPYSKLSLFIAQIAHPVNYLAHRKMVTTIILKIGNLDLSLFNVD